MNIIVLNLHRNINKEALKALFTEHGEVASCDIVLDKETGTSKGFGFVTMLDETHAQKAISSLNGQVVNNQKIRVKAKE